MFVMYPVTMRGLEPIVTASVNTVVEHMIDEYKEIDNVNDAYLGDINGQEYTAPDAIIEQLESGSALYIKDTGEVIWIVECVELS